VTRNTISGSALLFLLTAILASDALAQSAPLLPGGASSLRETHQDWQVLCAVRDKTKYCTLSQQQTKQGTNQLVLTIELVPGANNVLNGMLLMPFGLLLSNGITLQIDDKPPGKPIPFRTCLPNGCVVPLSFDKSTVDTQRAASNLKIAASASDTNETVRFTVSLKGFGPAIDRTREVSGSTGPELRR
jgi:invasion protein IalB